MILKHSVPLSPYNRWIDWFAWYPVWATNEYGEQKLVWLENVEYYRTMSWDEDDYQYRFVETNY